MFALQNGNKLIKNMEFYFFGKWKFYESLLLLKKLEN